MQLRKLWQCHGNGFRRSRYTRGVTARKKCKKKMKEDEENRVENSKK